MRKNMVLLISSLFVLGYLMLYLSKAKSDGENIGVGISESHDHSHTSKASLAGDEGVREPQGLTRVQITPERQQLIGIRTEKAAIRELTRDIRTVGIVEADETKIARVSIKFSGWIKDVFVNYIGKYVERGEPLFTVYSPELVSTQEEYLLALRARDSFGRSSFPEISQGAASLIESTKRRLLLWDISEKEVERIEKTGVASKYLTLYSPISGYVTKREAYPEKMVMPNEVLFEVVDLSSVWVLADIYEYELPLVKEGQQATLSLSYYPEDVFRGKVTYVYPTLATETRTLKVRFEFENAGMKLKPGMYANVRIHVPLGKRLSIAEDSVIDTGERTIVFVAIGGGYFEPREVVVGSRANGYYEVLHGVEEGEVVVRGATFLVDSESRLRAALEGFGMPGHDHGTASEDIQHPQDVGIDFEVAGGVPVVGDNTFQVALTGSDGTPIKNATVDVLFHMPPMPAMGMPAMNVSAKGKPIRDGLYEVKANIPMSGTWQVKVTVSIVGKPPVSKVFEINVR